MAVGRGGGVADGDETLAAAEAAAAEASAAITDGLRGRRGGGVPSEFMAAYV